MTPEFATIPTWTALTGIGRTRTYHLIAEGKLRAVKAGKQTLIDVPKGLEFLHSLPPADIRCAPRRPA